MTKAKAFLGILLLYKAVYAMDVQQALLEAARQGDEYQVKKLLASNAFAGIACDEKDTVVHQAAAGNQPALVQILLQNSPVLVNATNSNGETPLHSAVLWEHKAVVQVLLEHQGIHILATSREGWTPVHTAARFGKTEILELLLARARSVYMQQPAQLYLVCMSAHALAQRFNQRKAAEMLLHFLQESGITYEQYRQMHSKGYSSALTIIENYI